MAHPPSIDRRTAIAGTAALLAAAAAGGETTMATQPTIACFIRYQIDPWQRDAFRDYAAAWGRIIPRCGGRLIGYFLPWEGTNDIGWGLIGFASLADYEAYRGRLRADPEARANFAKAVTGRFILREERSFVEIVDGTFAIGGAGQPVRNGG